MLLKLQYKGNIQHETRAAFIRGSAPGVWFKELNRWNIESSQLECYLVPQSVQSLEPAGLLVVFRNGHIPKTLELMEPYGMIADRLFVPVHSQLTPQVNPEELQNLLLWERQVFHPTIGLVGFAVSDRVNLTDLLDVGEPANTDWSLAKPGIPPKKKLQQIAVQQPALEDVMDSFKDLVDTQSLEQLMKKEQDTSSMLKELFQNLQQNSLNAALSVIQKIKEAWSSRNSEDQGKNEINPSMLDKLENWIKENLADLEKKRNNEIKRLLNLFDENTDEALKHAIPLDSPYLNRGTANPSSKLGTHSTDFDLNKLGGGQSVDNWNVDSYYYHDLRIKYQKVAQKEIEAKDYKKAAYIYAHLLGDFQSAANVLEQGKHYREAAVLYKDHLHHPAAAAACLERGGLLLEAIEQYDKLNKYEKVGDLYRTMEQPENAEKYYEQSIEHLLANKDYLDASRVIQEKVHNPERAMQTLFKGWTDSNQSESCLKKYVHMQYEADQVKAVSQLPEIFAHHTPKYKKNEFLNVLTYMNEQKHDPELLDTSRNIAYEIISEELERGKVANLPALQKFLPDDPLIASDCSRFTARKAVRTTAEPVLAAEVLQLDKGIKWISAVIHRNQFLVLGIRNARLQLARGNWYGNLEYYSWNDHIKATDYFMLIADPLRSNRVILHTSGGMALEEKQLPKSKYFDDELIVYSPTWLSRGYSGISFNSQGGITALTDNTHKLSLHHYTLDVYLQYSTDCQFEGKAPMLLPTHYLSEMIYRNGFYYTFQENLFLKISEEGVIRHTDVNAIIGKFAASTHYAKFRLALATDQGCLLMRQVGGELKPEADFFAQEIDPVDIKFVSGNRLVVAGKYKALVYEIQEDEAKMIQTFDTQSPIVALLSTSDRHQIALLEEKGKISVHKVL